MPKISVKKRYTCKGNRNGYAADVGKNLPRIVFIFVRPGKIGKKSTHGSSLNREIAVIDSLIISTES